MIGAKSCEFLAISMYVFVKESRYGREKEIEPILTSPKVSFLMYAYLCRQKFGSAQSEKLLSIRIYVLETKYRWKIGGSFIKSN